MEKLKSEKAKRKSGKVETWKSRNVEQWKSGKAKWKSGNVEK